MSQRRLPFITNLAWSTFGTVGGAVIRLAVLILLARLIDVSAFGLYSFAAIIIGLISNIIDFGLSAAYIQSPNANKGTFRLVTMTNTLAALALSLVLYWLFPWIAGLTDISLTPHLYLCTLCCLIIKALGAGAEAHLQKTHQFRSLNIIELGSYFISYGVVAVILAQLGYGVWALFIAMLLQFTLKSTACLSISKPFEKTTANSTDIPKLFHYGLGLTIGQFANYLANQGDQLLISKLLGITALGYYCRSFQLAIMPINMLGQAVDKVLFPMMSQINHRSESIYPHFVRAMTIVYLLAIPLSLLLSQIGSDLVIFLLGEKWQIAADLFPIMVLSMVFRLSNKVADTFFRAIGAVYIRSVLQWLFLINVASGVLFSYQSGLEQVVQALFLVYALNSTLLLAVLCYRLKGSFLRILAIAIEVLLTITPVALVLYFTSTLSILHSSSFLYLVATTFLWIIACIGVLSIRTMFPLQSDLARLLNEVKLKQLPLVLNK